MLVANLVDAPYRFTRDIDFLRRKGPPDPDEIKERFEAVLAVTADDGIVFGKVRTARAQRERVDILDVAVLSDRRLEFEGAELLTSLQATFDRRETRLGIEPLDAMIEEPRGRRWEQDWAAMVGDKAAKTAWSLTDAVVRFDRFVRPILVAMDTRGDPGTWPRGGPWTPPDARGQS